MTGVLSIVGTPIGNLDDLSPRAARTLAEADIIACEDTRVARVLLTRVATIAQPSRARLVAYHARNEHRETDALVRAINGGARVALTTDAGMPGLSDPGRRLVDACVEAGTRIEVVPGPSAALAALVASGLPTARFVFEGFLPRTATARRRRLQELERERRTIVLFEAPHRVRETLADAAAIFGDRRAALTRELTKIHEEIVRRTLPELAELVAARAPRGEITIVIEGAEDDAVDQEPETLARAVEERVRSGESKRDAIAAIAVERGVGKKVVYQAVLDHADDGAE